MPDRPTFQLSIEAQEIIRRLERCSVGDTVTYEELNEIVTGDVRAEDRSALNTARRHMLRDGKCFGTIPKVGIKYLNAVETSETGTEALHRVSRAARRAIQRVDAADYDSLTPSQRVSHDARKCALAVMAIASQPKKIIQLEGQVSKMGRRLEIGETLEALRGGKKETG